MTDHVLVPVDGSPLSTAALRHALTTFPEATITALFVIDPVEAVYAVEAGGLPIADNWYEEAQTRATTILEAAQDIASESGRTVQTETDVGRPSRMILRYVDDEDVDHVIMGSHGRRGIDRLILGSVTETVMRRSSVPVTVLK